MKNAILIAENANFIADNIFLLFVHWNKVHTGEVSDVGNWIQFGTDFKDWKCKDLKLKWCKERIWLWGKMSQLDMEVKSDWMLICLTFVTKSPRKRLIVIEKLGKARNKNGEENNPLNKLHELIVRTCVNYIIIYRQIECIDKYQIELCSTYVREYDFDVIFGQFEPWRKLRLMSQACK